MDEIYRCILKGLCEAKSIKNEGELDRYLQSLKTYVIQLRQSYRNNLVSVDYTDSRVQAAYLLAYYPQYAEMTFRILDSLIDLPFERKSIHACFFGSGPAPETIGWVTYLKKSFPNVKHAEAHTYDISADAWTFSRNITETYVAPSSWTGELVINAESIDLCMRNSMRQIRLIKDSIERSTLFVIQNCLNEIAVQPNEFILNLGFLLNHMPNYAVLIVADLSQYDTVISLKRRIEGYITAVPNFQIVRSHTEGANEFRSSLTLPRSIIDNLLTGEENLIPRVNIRYNYLVAQKIVKAL